MNIFSKKQGLNGFQLKILALIFMTLDHIYYYLGGILAIPSLFTVIGRLAAPIFFFALANGFAHTRSRYKYALRLYLFSAGMGIINIISNAYFPHPLGKASYGNIFATLFLVIYMLICIEKIRSFKQRRRISDIAVGLAFLLIPFILQAAVIFAAGFSASNGLTALHNAILLSAQAFLPLPLTVEGGIMFVILGIGFYYLRGDRVSLSVFYIAFSLMFLAAAIPYGFTAQNLLADNCQWAMVFALPFMLAYNGEKGRGMKYLFYFYYPAHKIALTALAVFLFAK